MKKGTILTVIAYTLWGLMPLYWKSVQIIPPYVILAYRVFFTGLICASGWLFSAQVRLNFKAAFQNKRKLFFAFLAGLSITANWYLYIWIVNSSHVLTTSLAYFINPLLVMLCGALLFHERMNRREIVAIIIATIGVITVLFDAGKIPWDALILALTFTLYGIFKKLADLETFTALSVENCFVFPFAVIYLIWAETSGQGASAIMNASGMAWLSLAGLFSALPILLYGAGVRSVPLSLVGILHFICPTMTFFQGVFLFNEPFSTQSLISFAFIWVAVLLFIFSKRTTAQAV